MTKLNMCTSSHYDVAVRKRDGKLFLILRYKLNRLEHTEKEISLESPVVYLRTTGNKDVYSFSWSVDGATFGKLGEMDVSYLSSETAGGFTGVYLALYTQSNPDGGAAGGYADFDWFEYKD